MTYKKFRKILNTHILEGDDRDLLIKIASKPERFIGLFRPTKPRAKVLQFILQSHEIRFGDAIEELISKFLEEWGYKILPPLIFPDPEKPRKKLSIDQYFKDDKKVYFIEQKIRDDHDSTKKRGQINNFEAKLEFLYKKHKERLEGILYFIDPDLVKNKNYYLEKLKKMKDVYKVKVSLFYGKELFEYFGKEELWEDILDWLSKWKKELPELPEINLDKVASESFEEVKNLEIRYWRKILENEKLWQEGIIRAIFREGKTLRLLKEYFERKRESPYQYLAKQLKFRLKEYYSS